MNETNLERSESYQHLETDSENSALEYTDEPESREESPLGTEERIEEDDPLEETPNPLSTSEILFGERRPSERNWNPFSFETEPDTNLEQSFQALSLDNKPETKPSEPGGTMAQPGNTNDAREVKMNYPKTFTGNRNETKRFMQDCDLYLTINDKIYDTDMKKIALSQP